MGIITYKKRILFLLVMLIALAQCGLALYIPSLPSISIALKASPNLVQLTVVYYIIGIGVSQLIYGPLSDHYGRKRTVLFGVYVFLIGTILAVSSKSIYVLLSARLIQGLGIGSATTISRAILRDVFKDKEYVKIGSQLAGAVAIAPIIAPILGGVVQADFGWRCIFYLLLLMTIIMLVCWHIMFKETNFHINKEKISILPILQNYSLVIKTPTFIKNVICCGLIYSGEVVFLSITPFLVQTKLGLSSSIYGWMLFFVICGYMLGTNISTRLSNKIKCSELTLTGVSICSLASIIMLIFGVYNIFNIMSLAFALSLFMLGAGFVYPNTSVSAVSKFPDMAGTASALFSSGQGALAAIAGILASVMHSNTLGSMAYILVVLSLLSLLCILIISQFEKRVVVSQLEID